MSNADQLTPPKLSELKKSIHRERPLIIAKFQGKNFTRFQNSLHTVNLDSKIGRGVAVYTHNSLDKPVVKIKFRGSVSLELRLRGGDLLLLGCFYRSNTLTSTPNKNNENLNKLLQCISNKTYSHKCFVGDFNFKDINWKSWTTLHNEGSREAKFTDEAMQVPEIVPKITARLAPCY